MPLLGNSLLRMVGLSSSVNIFHFHSLLFSLFDFFCSGGRLSLALLAILRPLVLHFFELFSCRDLGLVNLPGALGESFDLAILEDLALSIRFASARVILLRRGVDDALVDRVYLRSGCVIMPASSGRMPMTVMAAMAMVMALSGCYGLFMLVISMLVVPLSMTFFLLTTLRQVSDHVAHLVEELVLTPVIGIDLRVRVGNLRLRRSQEDLRLRCVGLLNGKYHGCSRRCRIICAKPHDFF